MIVKRYCHFAANFFPHIYFLQPLLLRVILASVFIQTGWNKLHNIDGVISFFTTLAISNPIFNAYLVSYSELICGILLLLGVLTRFAAIPLAVIMLVATLTDKASQIHTYADLLGMDTFLYLVMCMCLIITGAGKLSFDHWFFCKSNNKVTAS